MQSNRATVVRGAAAGAVAAGIWAAQQPVDKRLFGVDYDDAELLGTLATRGPARWPIGLVAHIANGAAFGAAYTALAPRASLPGWARGAAAGLTEHLLTWPLTTIVARVHPARDELPVLWGSGRAFAQATWRHVLFGAILGALEQRLNPPPASIASAPSPDEHTAATNGHGNLDHALSAPPI